MREGTALFAGDTPIGHVTSGGFGPTVGGPIAMGYVLAEYADDNTALTGTVRGKPLPARIVPLPFHQTSYKR
jgi:aminomethyltransferase